MWKQVCVGSFFLFMSFSTGAFCEVSDTGCNELAKTIATGYTNSFSSEEMNSLEWYRNCEASSDKPSGELSIGYNSFNIAGRWSDEKKKEFCNEDYKDKNISKSAYNSVKNIFTESLSTIKECLSLAANSWNINYNIIGKDSFSVTVSNKNGTGNFVSGVYILPPESMHCSGIPAQERFPVTIKNGPGETLSIVCNRNPSSQVVQGMTFTYSDDTALVIQLADKPFTLRLPGYKASLWNVISEKIDSSVMPVAAIVSGLKSDLTKWKEPQIDGNQIGSGDFKGTTVCPTGQYAVGLKWWGAPSGIKYCIGCASGLQVVCRPLNVTK